MVLESEMNIYIPPAYMDPITLFIGGGRSSNDTAVIDMDQLQTNFINPKAQSNGMFLLFLFLVLVFW